MKTFLLQMFWFVIQMRCSSAEFTQTATSDFDSFDQMVAHTRTCSHIRYIHAGAGAYCVSVCFVWYMRAAQVTLQHARCVYTQRVPTTRLLTVGHNCAAVGRT